MAENGEVVQTKEAEPQKGAHILEAEQHITKLNMHYLVILFTNLYMERNDEVAKQS